MSVTPSLSESSWDKPAAFPSDESSESNKEGQKVQSLEEAPEPKPEQTSGGEEGSDAAPPPQQAEDPEQASQQTKVPKISFRVRRPGDQ